MLLLLLLLLPFYGPLVFVWDYPGEPVPEKYNQEGKIMLDLLNRQDINAQHTTVLQLYGFCPGQPGWG